MPLGGHSVSLLVTKETDAASSSLSRPFVPWAVDPELRPDPDPGPGPGSGSSEPVARRRERGRSLGADPVRLPRGAAPSSPSPSLGRVPESAAWRDVS
ncbi:hypothetical protein G6O67_000179 [Ophiocordyceps sinensis]|uniref:Uncharacterized protein n=1 Tax=Ophiocordyceps sinensis TaxID=72228 RepID=A0A8H4PYQ3_9HYPO|nr:hypothetical protein G6O67_000179 [Ophiocordyceps sinensis]